MDNKTGKKIKIIKDGPYFVTGRVPLEKEEAVVNYENIPVSWKKTGDYPGGENYCLCRCGRSLNTPFCDNSHQRFKFKGASVAARNKFLSRAEMTAGPDLDLLDDVSLCAQARFCHRDVGVWNLTVRSDDPIMKKTAIEESVNCPAGRLVAREKKSAEDIEPKFTPSISVTEDPGAGVSGPLWVKGGIPVEDTDGYIYEKRNRVTLCRCGRSKNKPFCDGSHIRAKFKDSK
jgi:CDGSH-type Zn-finger protein